MPEPTLNSEDIPAVPFTDEQKYIFDVRGWIAVPGLLTDDDVAEMREFCGLLRSDSASLPEKDRSSVGGPLHRLTDHPVVVGFMEEFVAHAPLASDDGYGFRLDGSFFMSRSAGDDSFRPHGGNGMLRFPGNHHTYNSLPGAANSGLTRVVWELNPVSRGTGGTLFLSGSHKAAFPAPASTESIDSHLWDTYDCPAGSVLFFTEAIRHTGAVWTNEDHDRVAVFNCYNTVGSKWHKWEAHPDLVASMPYKRRSLFRPVHCQDNRVEAAV